MRRLALVLLTITCLLACLKASGLPQNAAAQAKPKTTKAKLQNEGEQKFKQNCSRCHVAPEAISPREVKAVTRHMRVRAMLSAEDEKLILKFLAP